MLKLMEFYSFFEFYRLLKDSKNPVCPLCDEFVDLRDCVLINDPRPYLFPADQY